MNSGDVMRVTLNGTAVAVFRLGERFYALADVCTHEEASLSEGCVDVEEETVECPKHGAVFHIPTGQVYSLPAEVPAPVFDVTLKDGAIYVHEVARS